MDEIEAKNCCSVMLVSGRKEEKEEREKREEGRKGRKGRKGDDRYMRVSGRISSTHYFRCCTY